MDALCVNQPDEEEKLDHIRLIGDAYTQARSVCIWLRYGDFPGLVPDEEHCYILPWAFILAPCWLASERYAIRRIAGSRFCYS